MANLTEIFIMDNSIPPTPFPATCVIKLDQLQYKFYKKSRIELQAPNGRVLTVLRKPIPHKTYEDAIFHLWCQTCVLEVWLDEIDEAVKLPQRTIDGITHSLERIDGHLKKQLSM